MTELSLSLSPGPTASQVARSGVRDRFAGVLGRNTMADLELVVSELVTNAFDHGRGTIQLDLAHDGDELHGSVTDDGHGCAYENRTVADHERGDVGSRSSTHSSRAGASKTAAPMCGFT